MSDAMEVKIEQDPDSMNLRAPFNKQRIRYRRKFTIGMVEAEELIIDLDGVDKMIWCRAPFDQLKIHDGHELRNNMLFHVNLTPDVKDEEARQLIKKAFMKHWGI